MAEPSLNREYRSYSQFSEEAHSPARPTEPLRVVHNAQDPEDWDALDPELVGRAYHALKIAFTAIMLFAGVDKFTAQLTDWPQYLAPAIPRALVLSPQVVLYFVGIWEIFLAVGIVLRPRVFAEATAVWLGLIVMNLLLQGQFFDIALRDFGLTAAAYALARLGEARERTLRA